MTRTVRSQAIARTPLHLQLVELLRDLIISGELAPGAKIQETVLCERFGVSRTPLREALKVLASEEVVVLTPHHGAAVATHSIDQLRDAFDVIGALEALAGELAVQRISNAEIAAIARLHERMVRHFEAGRHRPYFEVNRQIHDAIFAATRNRTLQDQYRLLSARMMSARYLAPMSPDRWRQAITDHDKILAALQHRNGTALARVLKRHLAHKFETVRAWLEREAGA